MSNHGIASGPKSLRAWKKHTSVALTPRDAATKTIDRAVAAFLAADAHALLSSRADDHVAAKIKWNDLTAAFEQNRDALPLRRKARIEKQFALLQLRGVECMAFDEARVLTMDDNGLLQQGSVTSTASTDATPPAATTDATPPAATTQSAQAKPSQWKAAQVKPSQWKAAQVKPSPWKAAIDRALREAEPFVEQRCPLSPWEAPERSKATLYAYITDVLESDSFQKDPQAYLKAWDVRRGYTKEFRVPEDSARRFFKEHFG